MENSIVNAKPTTFCNPVNINYAYRVYDEGGPVCIEAADPVVLLFKDEYYLFSSVTEGYWFSEDLAVWNFIRCTEKQLPGIFGYAPAAMVMDGYVYWHQGYHDKHIYRNNDPKNPDGWELVNNSCYLEHDPFIYYDETEDKVWASYGCGDNKEQYIKVQEVDRNTLEPIGEIYECIFADQTKHGWERPYDNHTGMGWGYTEGSQLWKYKDLWYLTYSGYSLHKCYGNGVYTAPSAKGPYTFADNNPVSHKNTGFIGGAGHGCFFQDKYGNWWNATCASVYISHPFERRVNIYPAGIDENGYLYVNTTLSDYPISLPAGKRDHRTETIKGWMLLSKDKPATASSTHMGTADNPMYGKEVYSTEVPDSRDDHNVNMAFDDDIRTLWCASSGNEGEWLKVDLEKICSVNAVQINFATYNVISQDESKKYYQYRVEYSPDDINWFILADKWNNHTFIPHDYLELTKPIQARYIKVTNRYMAGDGWFAISDLRVFGNAGGKAPQPADTFSAVRDEKDPVAAHIEWKTISDTEGYIVRYGIAPDKLYNQYQIYGSCADVRTLNVGVSYYFRIDTFNSSGYTKGTNVIFVK